MSREVSEVLLRPVSSAYLLRERAHWIISDRMLARMRLVRYGNDP